MHIPLKKTIYLYFYHLMDAVMQKIYFKNIFDLRNSVKIDLIVNIILNVIIKNKKTRGLPGIEPGTASTLKKNHTTRPKPQLAFLLK